MHYDDSCLEVEINCKLGGKTSDIPEAKVISPRFDACDEYPNIIVKILAILYYFFVYGAYFEYVTRKADISTADNLGWICYVLTMMAIFSCSLSGVIGLSDTVFYLVMIGIPTLFVYTLALIYAVENMMYYIETHPGEDSFNLTQIRMELKVYP
jgi:hypothetical protein